MATFRKRSSKWHVQVRRAGHPTLTRSFTHKSDADAWARKIERQIDSGDLTVDQRALKGLTVRDLLVRYQETITPSKRGARMERYKIATLLTHPISEHHFYLFIMVQLEPRTYLRCEPFYPSSKANRDSPVLHRAPQTFGM